MRYYTEISKEKFLVQVKDMMGDEEYPYEMPDRIARDILKVNFDFENFTDFNDDEGFSGYPVGYRELKPGFHIFFANAGGDWEYPVCFLFYWGVDGHLRGYTPKKGNVWDKSNKCAYDDGEKHDNEFNEVKMIEEILIHIVKK